jgi:hypothetical protein
MGANLWVVGQHNPLNRGRETEAPTTCPETMTVAGYELQRVKGTGFSPYVKS